MPCADRVTTLLVDGLSEPTYSAIGTPLTINEFMDTPTSLVRRNSELLALGKITLGPASSFSHRVVMSNYWRNEHQHTVIITCRSSTFTTSPSTLYINGLPLEHVSTCKYWITGIIISVVALHCSATRFPQLSSIRQHVHAYTHNTLTTNCHCTQLTNNLSPT